MWGGGDPSVGGWSRWGGWGVSRSGAVPLPRARKAGGAAAERCCSDSGGSPAAPSDRAGTGGLKRGEKTGNRENSGDKGSAPDAPPPPPNSALLRAALTARPRGGWRGGGGGGAAPAPGAARFGPRHWGAPRGAAGVRIARREVTSHPLTAGSQCALRRSAPLEG